MKNLRLLFFAGFLGCFLPVLAYAQGVFIPPRTVTSTVNGTMRPIAGATVTVCGPNSPGIPCTPPLANTVFQDSALTIPRTNPFFTDANGNYPQAALAGGIYTVTESAPGFVGFSYQLTVSCAPGANCTISGNLNLGSNSLAAGAGTLGSLDSWLWVDGTQHTTFAGTLALLPTNGGEVRIPPDYSETYTSTINVGSSTHPHQAVLGGNSTLTCNVTGGTGDCVDIHNASTFRGQTTGSTATRTGGSVLNLTAGANVVNVIGAPEGANLGGQGFFGLENLQIDNASGGTVSGAYVNLAGVLGLSSIKNVNVTQCRGPAFKVTSTANAGSGPLTLDNDWADCNSNVGGQPLLITANTSSSGTNLVSGGAYVHPGAGIAAITIDGVNTANILRNNVLLNNYVEDFTNNNNIGVKIADVGETTVVGGESALSGTGETGIDISEVTSGNTKSVVVLNYHCVGAAINCIKNHITGTAIGTSSAYVPLYIFGGSTGAQSNQGVVLEDISQFKILSRTGQVYESWAPGNDWVFGNGAGAEQFRFTNTGLIKGTTFGTESNCNINSVSPAACGSSPSGVIVVPTTTTTYTVNTTAVTANSRIQVWPITDNSGITGAPTCVAPPTPFIGYQSARVAGTSFTFTLPSTTGTSCWNYSIMN